MSKAFVFPKVIVLATNSEGSPEFFQVIPAECTQEQVDNGEHYDMAKENASFNGYEEPMMAFDANDQAARQLGELAGWL